MSRSIRLAAVALGMLSFAIPAHERRVILNEVYGGGGNSGSTFKNDFIELYNNGSSPVDISGYEMQYASVTAALLPSHGGTA